jgi:hypothetical protein
MDASHRTCCGTGGARSGVPDTAGLQRASSESSIRPRPARAVHRRSRRSPAATHRARRPAPVAAGARQARAQHLGMAVCKNRIGPYKSPRFFESFAESPVDTFGRTGSLRGWGARSTGRRDSNLQSLTSSRARRSWLIGRLHRSESWWIKKSPATRAGPSSRLSSTLRSRATPLAGLIALRRRVVAAAGPPYDGWLGWFMFGEPLVPGLFWAPPWPVVGGWFPSCPR